MHVSLPAKIPQVDVKLKLDDPSSREEIEKATMQLKVGKSPGNDGIPAEVYKHGGKAVLDKLQDLFTNCTKTREKDQTVQTIEASLCSQLQAKSWLASR